MKKRLIALLTAFTFLFCMWPVSVFAADGAITADGTYDLSAYGSDSTVTIHAGLTVTLKGASTTYSNLKIVCVGANTHLTLDNVIIDDSFNDSACALAFSGADNTLTLIGESTLKSGSGCAGLAVPEGTELTITKDSTGSLTATCGNLGAGIGGSYYQAGGTVNISGGTVTANGGLAGAGIGGGVYGAGGTVNISGGTVTANGGLAGAGIGGGNEGAGGTVNISGGTVEANGGDEGLDIGAGRATFNPLFAGSLYISGGSVNADFFGAVYQTSARTAAVYKTVVSGLPVITDVACSYNNGDVFSCKTDANGYLYLWLPRESATVLTRNGGNYYLAVGTIAEANSNTLTTSVYRLVQSSIDLTALSVTGGTLSQTFDRDVAAYSVTADSGSFGDSIAITATTVDSSSGLTINGVAATSGVASTISLNNGANLIPVTVTSAGGMSRKTYILSVNGTVSNANLKSLSISGASLSFDKDTTSYAVSIGRAMPSIDITASASDGKAVMLLNGAILPQEGTRSVGLSAGKNTVSLMVVAQDATTKTYTITINRDTTGSGNGAYLITPDIDAVYTAGLTNDGLPTMTVKSGVKGFTYFTVNIEAVAGHTGMETAVFVQIRDGQQIALSFLNADFDTVGKAGAGFNVKAGDIIEVYLVDSLSNTGGSPSIL